MYHCEAAGIGKIFPLQKKMPYSSSFWTAAGDGGVIVVSGIKAAYEQKLGQSVPKSTVYRMLARHDWRQIVPRPRHPKSDIDAQEAFKKTSRKSSRSK